MKTSVIIGVEATCELIESSIVEGLCSAAGKFRIDSVTVISRREAEEEVMHGDLLQGQEPENPQSRMEMFLAVQRRVWRRIESAAGPHRVVIVQRPGLIEAGSIALRASSAERQALHIQQVQLAKGLMMHVVAYRCEPNSANHAAMKSQLLLATWAPTWLEIDKSIPTGVLRLFKDVEVEALITSGNANAAASLSQALFSRA